MLAALPLTDDKGEGEHVYGLLLQCLMQNDKDVEFFVFVFVFAPSDLQQHLQVMDNIVEVVRVFGAVLLDASTSQEAKARKRVNTENQGSDTPEQTVNQIIEAVRFMSTSFANDFAAVVAQLPAEIAQALRAATNPASSS